LKNDKAPKVYFFVNEYVLSTVELMVPVNIKFLNVIYDAYIIPSIWLEGKIRFYC